MRQIDQARKDCNFRKKYTLYRGYDKRCDRMADNISCCNNYEILDTCLFSPALNFVI